MIRKCYRLPLLVILAVGGLLGVCFTVMVLRQDPDLGRFDRIREGITMDEAVAVMGRPPDGWLKGNFAQGVTGLPGVGAAGVWGTGGDDAIWIWFDDSGRAGYKEWKKYSPEPFWDRLRRWLHL